MNDVRNRAYPVLATCNHGTVTIMLETMQLPSPSKPLFTQNMIKASSNSTLMFSCIFDLIDRDCRQEARNFDAKTINIRAGNPHSILMDVSTEISLFADFV